MSASPVLPLERLSQGRRSGRCLETLGTLDAAGLGGADVTTSMLDRDFGFACGFLYVFRLWVGLEILGRAMRFGWGIEYTLVEGIAL